MFGHNHTYRHKHLIPAISTVVPPEEFVQQLKPGHQQVIQQDLCRPGRPGPSKDTAPEFGHSQRSKHFSKSTTMAEKENNPGGDSVVMSQFRPQSSLNALVGH